MSLCAVFYVLSGNLRNLHSFPTRRSSDLVLDLTEDDFDFLTSNKVWIATDRSRQKIRSEERFSRNAETDLVCRLLLEKKNVVSILIVAHTSYFEFPWRYSFQFLLLNVFVCCFLRIVRQP